MRKILIAGNWKMHKTPEEALSFAASLKSAFPQKPLPIDLVVCPPFPALTSVAEALSGSAIAVGAQNLHWETEGAFTGEVSPAMLKAAGCQYVIVGHSERRAYFSETNAVIRQKLKSALQHGLFPIVCVGERLEEREKNRTLEVIEAHLSVFQGIEKERAKQVIVAYEPVWAIGTGRNATPEQAEEVHAVIRKHFQEMFDRDLAEDLRILYGGSVRPDNIDALLARPDIDGALVGGASLQLGSFQKIVQGGLSRMKVRVS